MYVDNAMIVSSRISAIDSFGNSYDQAVQTFYFGYL